MNIEELTAAILAISQTEPATFRRFTIPLVRRIYPSLDSLMPIQPLSGPAELIYYLRNQHGLENEEGEFLGNWDKEGF